MHNYMDREFTVFIAIIHHSDQKHLLNKIYKHWYNNKAI